MNKDRLFIAVVVVLGLLPVLFAIILLFMM
jgi:hypothetical protein